MFPMIADVAKLLRPQLLDLELERAAPPWPGPAERLRVGVMFEVPALAWQLDSLLPHVDFVSVGTNDLSNSVCRRPWKPRVAGRIRQLVASPASSATFCGGEGRPAESTLPSAARWQAAGRGSGPAGVGSARCRCRRGHRTGEGMIRSLDLPKRQGSCVALRQPDRPMRETLRLFAADHAIEI
jgi:phosphotransferase system enzyme I (PtsP)